MANYKDSSLPVEERLKDLMQRMTFEEKIDQITCLVTITEEIPDFKEYVPNGIGNVGAFTVADSVEEIVKYADKLQRYLVNETRLGIPALIHCEACAGAQYTEADVFPSAIAQASTFDPAIVEQMAGHHTPPDVVCGISAGTLSCDGRGQGSEVGKNDRDIRRRCSSCIGDVERL